MNLRSIGNLTNQPSPLSIGNSTKRLESESTLIESRSLMYISIYHSTFIESSTTTLGPSA